MTPHWLAHVFYILDAIDRLEQALTDNRENGSNAPLMYHGVIHLLQTLAESATKLPDDIKGLHPHIDWASYRDLRNELAHDYLTAPPNVRLIEIVEYDLPPLKKALLQHVPNWDDIKADYRYEPD
jgi:uncharacterized protein with HEPN domain